MLTRRSFLTGLIAAPAVIRTPGLLMPVRNLVTLTPAEIANEALMRLADNIIYPPLMQHDDGGITVMKISWDEHWRELAQHFFPRHDWQLL